MRSTPPPPSPSPTSSRCRPRRSARAWQDFSGVKRRFTRTGTVGGITVIDDYGHHPVEIAAVLKAARQSTRRDVIAVVQPHRYTRLHDLFDDFATCFNDADTVIVAPVYAAGEQPIEGVTHEELVARIRARGHRDARVIDRPGRPCAAAQRPRRRWRLRRLPRRRQHHAMGRGAAGRTGALIGGAAEVA